MSASAVLALRLIPFQDGSEKWGVMDDESGESSEEGDVRGVKKKRRVRASQRLGQGGWSEARNWFQRRGET